MKVSTFNTNSIRARLPIILDWLKLHDPHVLCVQETKVQDKDFPRDAFETAGYQALVRGQKSYNGVAILSKLPADNPRRHLCDPNEAEARFICAKVNDIPIINVYVPQGFEVGSKQFENKLRWLEDLLGYIKKEFDPALPLILTGDFNIALEPIDVFDPDAFLGKVGFHPDEQAIFREFLKWGFVDMFRKHNPGGRQYTFWDYRIPNGFKRNLGWRIDYILATPPLAEKSRRTWIDTEPRSRPKPSDHTFLNVEFQIDV